MFNNYHLIQAACLKRILFLVTFILASPLAWAGASDLSFDIFAVDSAQTPLTGNNHQVTLCLMESDSAGSCLVSSEDVAADFNNGNYHTSVDLSSILDSLGSLDAPVLRVTIDGEDLDPLLDLDAVPFVVRSTSAEVALALSDDLTSELQTQFSDSENTDLYAAEHDWTARQNFAEILTRGTYLQTAYVTDDYTATDDDAVIAVNVDGADGPITISIPACDTSTDGQVLHILRLDLGPGFGSIERIVIQPPSGTLSGQNNAVDGCTNMKLTSSDTEVSLICLGTQNPGTSLWTVISGNVGECDHPGGGGGGK